MHTNGDQRAHGEHVDQASPRRKHHDNGLPQKSEKKRKLNHHDRKIMLSDEIRLLESGVAVLSTRGLLTPSVLQQDQVLFPAVEEQAGLLHAILSQQLRVAKMQSALSRCLTDQQYYPLYSRICLSKDWSQRRATLLEIREKKLRVALDFVMSQASSSDHDKAQFSENKYETAGGHLCCVRYESVQFPGVDSLQQVFNALWFFLTNMEIVISEKLGQITLRDDYDTADGRAINTRFISTSSSGITTEGNVVTYRRMLDENDDSYDGQTCAVVAVDSIDEDKLHPYVSDQRARRDASGAIVLTASRRHPRSRDVIYGADCGNEGELVVTMRRATFWKIYRPEFPMSELELQDFQDSMMQWSDIMVKTVRNMVYAT
ncbi:hypothetical protein PHYBOEH_007659 [Phytophthora boehmeriae]|uniref:Uncharacterized protein n=1 Tax=Phytophthora boehmeriae TaxID=109152 RepID=A0A8T1W6R4_9STRA|nr:hypothetical protein PHYBOEH_007659 [Phytophthora boehmeriae]